MRVRSQSQAAPLSTPRLATLYIFQGRDLYIPKYEGIRGGFSSGEKNMKKTTQVPKSKKKKKKKIKRLMKLVFSCFSFK